MDTQTAIILQTDPSPRDSIAEKFLRPLKRRLVEIESEVDTLRYRLMAAENGLRDERESHNRTRIESIQLLQVEKEARAKDVEWQIGQLTRIEEEKILLMEQVAELVPRPKEHWHDPDEPHPVLTLDLDGTLKPQIGRGVGGNYPLTDEYSDPFPHVKKWLDRWKAFGACLHIATAGLYYEGPQGIEVFEARLAMVKSWAMRYGLPIDLILPKIPSNVYYDDRMIEIPGDPALKDGPGIVPDWNQLGELAEKEMERRFFFDETGLWTRKEKKRVGEEITTWPDIKMFRDHPRGYSGPSLDVDMHRTLSNASSSMRVAPPREDAVETMRNLYEQGVTITVSCAGWNRQTHSQVDSIRRLAAIRRWLKQWSVPYDRVAEKDHADLYFDDKGVRYTGWKADLPRIKAKLPKAIGYRD
jgi:hypothetical protein